MTVQVLPKSIDGVVTVAAQSAAAVTALAATLNIKQNDPVSFTTDYYDFVGAPGTDPATAGKRGQLNQKRQAVNSAKTTRRNAIQAGRDFNARALDHLKGFLGRTWNPRWAAAGFTSGSLALPHDPVSLLLQFRAYFAVNTAHELPVNGITAAQANTLAAAIDASVLAEGQANSVRDNAVRERDDSFERLRARVVGLRHELDQLLDSDDMRWRMFGFSRPVDRRIPEQVESLRLRMGGVAGEIIVEWLAAVGAENYRVTRQIVGVDTEPAEVGLFTDRTVIIPGMPSGKNVHVLVTARNPAGETQPTEAAILVP